MTKIIQHKSILIINLVTLLILSLLHTAFAFETFGEFKKECKSVCHEAEHIKKSKQDKIFKPECKSCHIGIKNISPFSISIDFSIKKYAECGSKIEFV